MQQLAYFYTRIGSVEKRGVNTALFVPVRNNTAKTKSFWNRVISLIINNK
jgi:hypothetical protein